MDGDLVAELAEQARASGRQLTGAGGLLQPPTAIDPIPTDPGIFSGGVSCPNRARPVVAIGDRARPGPATGVHRRLG